MNYYQNFNPYYTQQQIPRVQPIQPMEQQYNQFTQPQYKASNSLQGKTVDSIDVVKATDIPLDFSISYFPLADGSSIVTKQLLQDGTTKMVVYKPTEEKPKETTPSFLTVEEFNKNMQKFDNSELKEEISNIKRQLKEMSNNINDIKDIYSNNRKQRKE